MFDYKFIFISSFMRGAHFSSHLSLLKTKILQSRYEHGYDETFSFFIDILPSTSFTGSYIRNKCFFDSLLYNK